MGEPQPQPQHSGRFPRADSEWLVPGDPEPCFPASELSASGPLLSPVSLVPTANAASSGSCPRQESLPVSAAQGRTEQGQGTTYKGPVPHRGALALPVVAKARRMEWWGRTRQTDMPQVVRVNKREINVTRRQRAFSFRKTGKRRKQTQAHPERRQKINRVSSPSTKEFPREEMKGEEFTKMIDGNT